MILAADRVVLDELDRVGEVVQLAETAVESLRVTGLVEVRPERDGRWRLLPCGTVGAVAVDGFQVQVTPNQKVGLSRLLFLLGYARNPGLRPEVVTASEEPDLWPALGASLARTAEAALERGVMQGYQRVDNALRVVRGRIRIGDQLTRRPGLMVPLEVSYDEFTVDIAENRILRTALRRLQAVPGLAADARRQLAHLDGRLDGVGIVRPGEPIPSWLPTRLNERYQPALRLAEVVLRYGSVEAGPGGLPMASFVVSMWRVFEDFVAAALTASLRRRPGFTRVQHATTLDIPGPGRSPGQVPMAVDIVHLVGGTPRMIFDAKYKVADARGRHPNADLYQMLAYCTAMGLPRAWLVYAQGGSGPVERRVRNSDITIVEYPLDLSAHPRHLLAQIDVLADVAWAAADFPHHPDHRAQARQIVLRGDGEEAGPHVPGWERSTPAASREGEI